MVGLGSSEPINDVSLIFHRHFPVCDSPNGEFTRGLEFAKPPGWAMGEDLQKNSRSIQVILK